MGSDMVTAVFGKRAAAKIVRSLVSDPNQVFITVDEDDDALQDRVNAALNEHTEPLLALFATRKAGSELLRELGSLANVRQSLAASGVLCCLCDAGLDWTQDVALSVGLKRMPGVVVVGKDGRVTTTSLAGSNTGFDWTAAAAAVCDIVSNPDEIMIDVPPSTPYGGQIVSQSVPTATVTAASTSILLLTTFAWPSQWPAPFPVQLVDEPSTVARECEAALRKPWIRVALFLAAVTILYNLVEGGIRCRFCVLLLPAAVLLVLMCTPRHHTAFFRWWTRGGGYR